MIVQITPPAIANIGWRTYIIFAVLNFLWLPIIAFFFPETKGQFIGNTELEPKLTSEQDSNSKMWIDSSRRMMVWWMPCMRRKPSINKLSRSDLISCDLVTAYEVLSESFGYLTGRLGISSSLMNVDP